MSVLLMKGTDYQQNATQLKLEDAGLTKISNASPDLKIYIQVAPPSVAPGIPYVWIDISGGDLNFWVEDGT